MAPPGLAARVATVEGRVLGFPGYCTVHYELEPVRVGLIVYFIVRPPSH